MSDENKSMEECAREQRDSFEREVRLAIALQGDPDDIDSDTWLEIEKWLSVPVVCDLCGEAPSGHREGEFGELVCQDDDDPPTEFEIADIDDLRDAATDEIDSRNYGAGISFTVDVTLYGGGPAGGIEFTCGRGKHGLEMYSARQWHQDWWKEKGWATLDDDVASYLWDAWGLEYLMEG